MLRLTKHLPFARFLAHNLSNLVPCPPMLGSRSLASPGARQNHLAHMMHPTFDNGNYFIRQPVYSFPAMQFEIASRVYHRLSCSSLLLSPAQFMKISDLLITAIKATVAHIKRVSASDNGTQRV